MQGSFIRDCDEILNELDEITHNEPDGILDRDLNIGIDWIEEICPWDGYDLGQNVYCDEDERREFRFETDTGDEAARDGPDENARHRNGQDQDEQSGNGRTNDRGEAGVNQPVAAECPVCMSDMSNHEVWAMPANCSHQFCVECLTSWAEKCTSCPLCRVSFSGIKVFTPEGVLLQRVRKRRLQEDDYESDVAVEQRPSTRRRPPSRNGQCCVCNRALRRHFIECMRCDGKFHEECMSVRLTVLHEQPVCYRCEDTPSQAAGNQGEGTSAIAAATRRRRRRRVQG